MFFFQVVFCSEDCREKGLKSFHCIECNLINTLEELDLGQNAQLVLRLVVQTSFTKLKDFVPSYEKELQETSPEKVGYNEDGVYDSTDYSTIYGLVTNKEQRSVADMFKRASIAYVLTKLLVYGQNFFSGCISNFVEPSKEEIVLIGCAIMTHLMNVPCNAHSITEFGACLENIQDSLLHDIGAGAYSVLSLCNHSCNPSGARTSFGNREVFRAITYITSGQEITDSYGKHYALQNVVERQKILKVQYYFTCRCGPCSKAWPLYENLKNNFKIKCFKCTGNIMHKTLKCSECNSLYSDKIIYDGVEFDYNNIYNEIQNTYIKYNQIYTDVLLGDSSPENTKFLENFLLLCRHIELPNKIYFEIQETLKHCYDKCSSYYYVC